MVNAPFVPVCLVFQSPPMMAPAFVPHGESGKLVIRKPWPSMLRTIYGDKPRYKKQYWTEVKGCYFTGDGARRDKDGYLDSDAVFGVRQSLVADWVQQSDGSYRMDYDFILPKIGAK